MSSIPMNQRWQAVTSEKSGGFIRKTVLLNLTPEECGPACQAIRNQREEREKTAMQQKTRDQIRAVVRGEVEKALAPVSVELKAAVSRVEQAKRTAVQKTKAKPRGIVISGGNSGGQFKPKY